MGHHHCTGYWPVRNCFPSMPLRSQIFKLVGYRIIIIISIMMMMSNKYRLINNIVLPLGTFATLGVS